MLLHKQVPLRNRKGEIVAVALVSDEDYERVASLNWCLGGAVHGTDRRYARRNFNGKTTYMHRFVMALSRADKDVEVDHINGDRLDNRRENLRVVPGGAQPQNQLLRSDSTSGYRGVSWDKARGKWKAHVTSDGAMKLLGRYDSAEQAAAVAAQARAQILPFSKEAMR